MKFKIKIGPLNKEDPLLKQEAVTPELIQANAAGRMVLVPPEVYPGLSDVGWVAKVTKVDKRKGITTVKFHDCTVPFAWSTVKEWKPVS